MKKLFWGILFLIPTLCSGSNNLDFDLLRTEETPGFFSVTVFPDEETKPIPKEIEFVKNFPKTETKKYAPILSFLTELGATIIESPSQKTDHTQIISIGNSFGNETNFELHDNKNPLDAFEEFSLQKLQPTFFQNIHAEFGGNIHNVEQLHTNIVGDKGITFIGKFEKDMRTRMLLHANQEETDIEFEIPLNLQDKMLSHSPIAKELPQLWEQLHNKKTNILPTKWDFSFFPWILGGIIILILIGIFVRRSLIKYNHFLETQDTLQEELPWRTVSTKTENTPSNPFEIK